MPQPACAPLPAASAGGVRQRATQWRLRSSGINYPEFESISAVNAMLPRRVRRETWPTGGGGAGRPFGLSEPSATGWSTVSVIIQLLFQFVIVRLVLWH